MTPSLLPTPVGALRLPAVVPITSATREGLDRLVRPYLSRLAPALACIPTDAPALAAEFPGTALFVLPPHHLASCTSVEEQNGLGIVLAAPKGSLIAEAVRPADVLEAQSYHAHVAFTVDCPVPPGTMREEAERRLRLTVSNGLWALSARQDETLPLYAVVHAWDAESARRCTEAFAPKPFAGIAIAGLPERAHHPAHLASIVSSVVKAAAGKPVHAFGPDTPDGVATLLSLGVSTITGRSYLEQAEKALSFGSDRALPDAGPIERMHLALANYAATASTALPLAWAPRLFTTAALAARGLR